MQKMLASQQMRMVAQRRMFSYNYSAATNPKVYLDVTKDGQAAGKLVFQLYENHSPALALNFAAFCNGSADGNKSFVGTTVSKGMPGYGFQAGCLGEENMGAGNERMADENLEMRHHKRGMLSMLNDGTHSNGSEFLVTFGAAPYLDGYQNVIGELVEGEHVLASIESTCSRDGKVSAEWSVSGSGCL